MVLWREEEGGFGILRGYTRTAGNDGAIPPEMLRHEHTRIRMLGGPKNGISPASSFRDIYSTI